MAFMLNRRIPISIYQPYAHIEGFYIARDSMGLVDVVINSSLEEVAWEIAAHCFGHNARLYEIQSNTEGAVLEKVNRLIEYNIDQTYIEHNDEIKMYKTRIQMIDEFLSENS